MKKRLTVRLRNSISDDIEICLEPEGTIVPFKSGEEKEIDIIGDEGTTIEIVIGLSSDGLNLAFWPDKGEYNVRSDR